ncbi:hypothetical protein DAMA08_027380 [Martiniozyma asiatica (nom. inval.)]|nr:hypothetical protein DAMA08_027380 [Martiniozyma asiatica]
MPDTNDPACTSRSSSTYSKSSQQLDLEEHSLSNLKRQFSLKIKNLKLKAKVKTLKKSDSFSTHIDAPFEDDVYKPFITPPTPFEASTTTTTFENLKNIKIFNPYSQSLWVGTGGNMGTEIEKYNKDAHSTTKPRLENNVDSDMDLEMLELKPLKLASKATIELKTKMESSEKESNSTITLESCDKLQQISDLNPVSISANSELAFIIPSPINHADSFKHKTSLRKRSGLIPDCPKESTDSKCDNSEISRESLTSLISNLTNTTSLIFQNNTATDYKNYHDDNGDGANGSDMGKHASASLNLSQNQINSAFSNILPIISNLSQLYKVINELSFYFNQYTNELMVFPDLAAYLFGNVQTLGLIYSQFFFNLLNKENIGNVEKIIFDHLQRLKHVFPSYFKSKAAREEYTNKIMDDYKSGGMLNAFVKKCHEQISDKNLEGIGSFKSLIETPILHIDKLLNEIDHWLSLGSFKIRTAVKTIRELIDESRKEGELNLNKIKDKEIYLIIPSNWHKNYRIHWKEINKYHIEDQFAFYLQDKLKRKFDDYIQLKNLVNSLIGTIAKLSTTNINIARNFFKYTQDFGNASNDRNGETDKITPKTQLFQQKMIKSAYELYVNKIDVQNKAIYPQLLDNEKHLQETNSELYLYTKAVLRLTLEIPQSGLDRQRKRGKLFDVIAFIQLFEEYIFVLGERTLHMLTKYFETINTTNVDENDTKSNNYIESDVIIDNFFEMRRVYKSAIYQEIGGCNSGAITARENFLRRLL